MNTKRKPAAKHVNPKLIEPAATASATLDIRKNMGLDMAPGQISELPPNEPVSVTPRILKIKKLHPDAKVPQYQTAGAACFDIHALSFDTWPLHRMSPMKVRTGLAFEVPEGYVMLVYSRSGHGFKDSVRLANCVGVVDSDYRGELMMSLAKDSMGDFSPNPGDRIAQAMLVPVEQWTIEVVDELSSTVRGARGEGSTGVV